MDERKRLAEARKQSRRARKAIVWRGVFAIVANAIFWAGLVFGTLSLVGCTSAPKGATVKTRTEAEIAIAEVREEWLKKCEFVVTERGNSIGELLKDYTDAAAALAECTARHNDFVDYIGPIVRKARNQ